MPFINWRNFVFRPLKNSLTLSSLFFLFSCAHQTTEQEALSRVCLQGSGLGRLRLDTQKYNFSYEMQLDLEKRFWKLLLNIPLHPPKLLSFTWEKAPSQRVKVSGLEGFAAETKQERREKKFFIKAMAMGLKEIESLARCSKRALGKGQKAGALSCPFMKGLWRFDSVEQELEMSQKITSEKNIAIRWAQPSQSFYKNWKLSVLDYRERETVGIQLFTKTCQQTLSVKPF